VLYLHVFSADLLMDFCPPRCSFQFSVLKFDSRIILRWAAKDVACLRPSLDCRGGAQQAPNVSFSTGQSEKLYSLLSKLYAVGGYSHTFGALDPVQVTQMAPHLSSIYISGWQCSSTASTTNEPGPDFADYPSKLQFLQR
jgi:isocitrate lyase